MKPFIPPKHDDTDWNPMIDEMIQNEIDRRPSEETDIRDSYEDEDDCDDLKFVL